MQAEPLVISTDRGLYCPAGDFYIDPWRPVPRAVITHAHGDHARVGSEKYLTAAPGHDILRLRLGIDANIDSIPFGQPLQINSVRLSLHPAGHIVGSCQVRVEVDGRVCVVSGDYKVSADRLAHPFEPLRCDQFISECTFGLPIYRWPPETEVFEAIHDWWRNNQDQGRTSILFAYALGKAQRILHSLDLSVGPILAHGSVLRLLPAHESQGIRFPEVLHANADHAKKSRGRAIVIAPPNAAGSTWIRKFAPFSLAMASGWMQVRGQRRRKGLDRGFVLSDHADWAGLNEAISATEAEEVWLTHGSTRPMTRWLQERGIRAQAIETQFSGEEDEPEDVPTETAADTDPIPPGAEDAP